VVDGAPGSYWLDLRADMPALALKTAKPVLVLQGERDYQVTMVDFAGWKKVLAGKPFATLKTYPKLNHLFMEGSGKSTPAEYQTPSHVSKEVLDDVVKWITGLKP